MMQLLACTVVQSALAVGGMALLTHALHGVPLEMRALATAFVSWWALAGVVALAASFIVLSMILSFAPWTTFIPLSTACSFACTIGISLVTGTSMLSLRTVLGMLLIVAGVAVIATQNQSTVK
jgi:multidrug transporter EmrE-like cation transporter